MRLFAYTFLFLFTFIFLILAIYSVMDDEQVVQNKSVELPVVTYAKSINPEFYGIDISVTDSRIIMEGYVRKAVSEIVMVCDGVEISDPQIPIDGFFSIISFKECEPSSYVWLETTYDGKRIESEYFPVKNRQSRQSFIRKIKAVPEFNTFGLVAVVVLGTLGMTMIRAKDI